jgi:Protein of unknown function (DUF4229)
MKGFSGTGPGRPMVVYTLGRFGLFALCFAVFYLAGMGLFLALLVAALISSLAGWFLLARQRMALGVAVETRLTQARERAAERTAREDAIADEIIAEQERRAHHQD